MNRRSEQMKNERERMKAKLLVHLIETSQVVKLPHLPDWAVPNGWDFWGRPWAYMDAPSGNSKVGVTSEEGKARVTTAVLVRLEREVQYLLDQNVAKSTSAAAMRVRKTRVFNDYGSLHEDDSKRISPYTVARTLFPRGWGADRSEVVHSLLKCWHAYRVLRVGQWLNPPMPQGDMTPEGCNWPVPLQEPKTLEGGRRPQDPVNTAGSSTEVRCIKTASVRAAELQAKVNVVTPATSGTPRTATNYTTALRQVLNTVQQRHQSQAPAEGEATEQDDSLPPVAPLEQGE